MSEASSDCVLIVDDDTDICETIRTILEIYGYKAVTANDGAEALALLRGGIRPSLIILDLMMPRMNGAQFRQAQLREPAFRAIPVMVLSCDGRAEAKAADLGLEVLRKPVELEVLLAAVRRMTAIRETTLPSDLI